MIRHLRPSASAFPLTLFNSIWVEGIFPPKWQQVHIVPIPKPGKDPHLADNQWHIALTCQPCKMQRMVPTSFCHYWKTFMHSPPFSLASEGIDQLLILFFAWILTSWKPFPSIERCWWSFSTLKRILVGDITETSLTGADRSTFPFSLNSWWPIGCFLGAMLFCLDHSLWMRGFHREVFAAWYPLCWGSTTWSRTSHQWSRQNSISLSEMQPLRDLLVVLGIFPIKLCQEETTELTSNSLHSLILSSLNLLQLVLGGLTGEPGGNTSVIMRPLLTLPCL